MVPYDEDIARLLAVSQGSEEALIALMERHKQPIFHFAYRLLGNHADATEITEMTFFKVFQKAHTFSPRGKVKTWIFSIALNLCRDLLRRQKKRSNQISIHESRLPASSESGQTLLDTMDSGMDDPAQSLQSRDKIAQLESTIHSLPEKLRVPFVFCILEDHSYDECGEMLKTTRKTVETRIYRARKQLMKALQENRPNKRYLTEV